MRDPTAFDQQVGRAIRRLRKGKEWTQDELASALGLSRTSVTNIESGRQAVSLELAWRIAAAFEAPLAKLVPTTSVAEEPPSEVFQNLRPGERHVLRRMIRTATR